jgi:sRNA-binding protein
MTSLYYKSERLRGLQESPAAVETLRTLWPKAFPKKSHLVKPLASGLIRQIAEKTGWSIPYTRGVLFRWKASARYCIAVIWNDRRVNLEGEETEETVDDKAREQARGRLAKIAARREKMEQEKAAEAAQREFVSGDLAAPAAE